HVLSERYLEAVRAGESPSELLTITYTRKAAAEMKRRIVEKLRTEGFSEEARLAQVGPISTVHGYCERLLREYPFDAGLDPSFEILSNDAARELIDRCTAEILADESSLEECERLFLSIRGIKSYTGVYRDSVDEWIFKTVDGFRTAGKTPNDLEDFGEDVRGAWSAFMERCAIEAGVPITDNWINDGLRGGGEPWMRAKTSEEIENKAAEATRGLASLAARVWRMAISEFDRTSTLDFLELETRALRLLTERPEVVAGKYKRLLIDEAQDLNPVQYRLIRATPVTQMLLVGDPQQSIYGFRGAERGLFVDFLQEAETRSLVVNWRSTSLLIDGMKRVFERLWGDEYRRMRHPEAEVSKEDPFASVIEGPLIEVWKTSRTDVGITRGVEALIKEEGVEASEVTLLVRSASYLENIVRELRSKGIDPQILGAGKKYFQRNEIRDLGSALTASANPYDNLAMLSLMRSPLVGVSFDGCLRCADAARSAGKAVYDVVIESESLDDSDAVRVGEMLRWLIPITEIADRVPAWEVLSRILADTMADQRFAISESSSQLIANSRRLLSIAIENRTLSAAEFGDWIANRQSVKISNASALGDAEYDSPEEGRMKIGTMHSAKGLEWETVIVDATEKPHTQNKDSLEIDPFAGILAVPLRGPGVLEKAYQRPKAHSAIAHRNQRAEIEETRRLFYVAMTRAKNRLAIVIDAAKKGPCSADILSGLAPSWEGGPSVRVRDFTQGAAEMESTAP
ncbi:MAG: UvrD-helicase domain-containing protein, partial [Fimbriimonadales bacterium]